MQRTFLPDDAVDAFLDAAAARAETLNPSVRDQLNAAVRDLRQAIPWLMAAAADAGDQVTYAQLPEDSAHRKRLILPAARMLFAALTTPPAWTCPHWQQIAPGAVLCDPPLFSCMRTDCLLAMAVAEVRAGHRWNHECDACGARTEMLWKSGRTIGPTYVFGHLCKACTEGSDLDVDVYAKGVRRHVGRRQPCPCGSGRRFKACHGRAAA